VLLETVHYYSLIKYKMTVMTWSSQLKVPPLWKPTADVLVLELIENLR